MRTIRFAKKSFIKQGPKGPGTREESGKGRFVFLRLPYKKNDNAHVEQKNWTHVRQLFGYDRVDDPILIPLMNEIYKAYWNPLQNFFTPVLKLKSKERIGGRVKKVYDEPKSPFKRLLESNYVPEEEKSKLKDVL